MPSISTPEEYLFEYELDDATSDADEQMEIELNEKYLSYDDEMEAFEDMQTEMAFAEPEEYDEYEDYYYGDDDYKL
jgi:hypothetical protein